jgi:hypothetical protein
VVPDLHLASHFPAWTIVPLDPDEAPDDNLEGVLARHHVSLPDQVDSRPEKIDRAEWLATIRKANVGFTRWVTKGVRSQSGARLKQRQLAVPLVEYRGAILLPASVAKTPQKAFGIPDFSWEPVGTLQPSVRTNGAGAAASLGARFEAALRMISMPAKLPPAESDPASILLADRGIDADCVFLHPERDVPPDVLLAAAAGNSPCTADAHGTHVWGIIGGRIPDVMRGVALIPERPAPEIHFWDFEKQTPGESPDFFDFVNGAVGNARVANFSFDFGRNLTPSQTDRITEMVRGTFSILYVVAAENRLAKYRRGGSFALPVGLNAEDNVLVVTALNEAGTGVWDGAARNNSEADDVVLLAAPGVGIPSACKENRVGVLDGTSQATAFVSGAAALLVRDGLDDSLQIKRRLAYTADVLPALVDGVAGGRLNVSRALGARHDKLCGLEGGDGTACDPWTQGVAHLGYKSPAGFTTAKTIVLKKSGGPPTEVPVPHLFRIAKASDEGFVAFYLEPEEARSGRLRRKRVAALEAFSDKDHHGSLVIRLDLPDGTAKDVDLETLGDFVRRGV